MKSLGQAGVIEPETEAMLMEYDVDYSEFTDEVLSCLPKGRPWTIPPEELKRRRDLRYHHHHHDKITWSYFIIRDLLDIEVIF